MQCTTQKEHKCYYHTTKILDKTTTTTKRACLSHSWLITGPNTSAICPIYVMTGPNMSAICPVSVMIGPNMSATCPMSVMIGPNMSATCPMSVMAGPNMSATRPLQRCQFVRFSRESYGFSLFRLAYVRTRQSLRIY